MVGASSFSLVLEQQPVFLQCTNRSRQRRLAANTPASPASELHQVGNLHILFTYINTNTAGRQRNTKTNVNMNMLK